MRRQTRLFETIQLLRRAERPVTAEWIAAELEVSVRTVYRDIAALQAMRTPIEGEAGIGYVMRRGYDLPALNFDREEVEALAVGLSMLARTGDTALQKAARRVSAKIEALSGTDGMLRVAPYGAPLDDPELGCVSKGLLRDAIREERKLSLIYRDERGRDSTRVVWPIAIVYHIHCTMLAAWCELRGNYRHFRTDRIYACETLEDRFEGEGDALRATWLQEQRWDPDGERREGSVDRAAPAR